MLKFIRFLRSTATKVIVLILIALAAGCYFAFPHKVRTAKNIAKAYYYVYKGDKQFAKQDLIGAIDNYEYALKLYPAHAYANYNLANIYAVYEDYINALEYYENAVKYRPKFMNARVSLGILLSEKFFEYDRAIKEYQYAIDNAPFMSEFPITLIYNNKEFLSYNKSVTYYNMGLAYKWKSLVYGQSELESRNSLAKAVEAYNKAIKYDKNNYSAYFNVALGYQLLGNKDKSKENYCKCIDIDPFDYDVHYNLAILLSSENNFIDAMFELEKAALIIDSNVDDYKRRYIFDVLNETTKKAFLSEEYQRAKEKLDNDPVRSYSPTFENGKVVLSDNFDLEMLKNTTVCYSSNNDAKDKKKDK